MSPGEDRIDKPILRRELDALRLDGNNCNDVVKVMLKKPHYQKLAKIQTRGRLRLDLRESPIKKESNRDLQRDFGNPTPEQ